MPFAPKPLADLTPESLQLRIRRAAAKNGYSATRTRQLPGWRISDRHTGTILAGKDYDLTDEQALAVIEHVPEGASISVSLVGLEDAR